MPSPHLIVRHRVTRPVSSLRRLAGSVLLGILTFVSACSGGGDKTPTVPPTLTSITVSLSVSSVHVGEPAAATAAGLDQKGGSIATGTVTWSSSAPTVASVSAGGVVTALAVGSTSITATASGKTGQATLTVTPIPIAAVVVTPSVAAVIVAGTQQLAASTIDAGNNVLTGRSITWTTSDPAKATVSATGLVTGVAIGTVTITATSEGKTGTAAITVANGAIITSVTPATLVPGASMTITGAGFGATIATNTVRIGGVVTTITSASANQLVATVPCIASGTLPVVVTNNNINSAAVNATVAGTVRTLSVGQAIVLTSAAESACNELPNANGSAHYLVTVFSDATSQNTLSDAELRGNPVPSAPAPMSALLAQPSRLTIAPQLIRSLTAGSSGFMGNSAAAGASGSASDREHITRLEAGRALYQQMRASGYRAPTTPARASSLRLSNALGDSRQFFYNYTCSDTTKRIGAKAIYVGTKAVIWEDTTNTRQSFTDANLATYYQRIGQLFDAEQYDVVKTNFGDPLLRDARTDADGKLNMIFTQRINTDNPSAAAFVNPCDQYPRTAAASVAASNFGEYFYAMVPTLAGSSPNDSRYADGWFSFIGRTVVHEVKHIASTAARVANNAPSFEESWLEEGLARQAEELWVRPYIHKVAWKANTAWGSSSTNGIYCDFNPSDAACLAGDATHRPTYGLRRQFNELLPKLLEPWNWSLFGDGTGQSGSVFYQTVWSFTRYAADRWASSEANFFTTVTSATTTGVTSLANAAGVSIDQMIGGWSLALYTDDFPGLISSSADLKIPTWNTREIYIQLSADPTWRTRFTLPFPLVPATGSFGAFTASQVGIRGGAAAYFRFSGTMSAAQVLDLRAFGGGAPAATLRIAIARLP